MIYDSSYLSLYLLHNLPIFVANQFTRYPKVLTKFAIILNCPCNLSATSLIHGTFVTLRLHNKTFYM